MSATNPPVPPVKAAPLPDYKDRSTGLVIFGILTLLGITGDLKLQITDLRWAAGAGWRAI